MTRPIEFRGKRVDNGEWVYGDLVHGQGPKYGEYYILPHTQFYPKGCHDLDGWHIDPATVGQFTGLHDRDGKKIWEGDVCVSDYDTSNPSPILFGEFSDCGAEDKETIVGFYWQESSGEKYAFGRCVRGSMSYISVIGNIHDNPELVTLK